MYTCICMCVHVYMCVCMFTCVCVYMCVLGKKMGSRIISRQPREIQIQQIAVFIGRVGLLFNRVHAPWQSQPNSQCLKSAVAAWLSKWWPLWKSLWKGMYLYHTLCCFQGSQRTTELMDKRGRERVCVAPEPQIILVSMLMAELQEANCIPGFLIARAAKLWCL